MVTDKDKNKGTILEQDLSKIDIKLVGQKEMFFKKDSKGMLADLSDIALIPYLEKETNNIIGTQLLVRRDDKNETKTYIFENEVLQDFYAPKNLVISSQGYKIYRNEYNGEYEAVLAFANLSKKVQND